jgi:hypothetical protein
MKVEIKIAGKIAFLSISYCTNRQHNIEKEIFSTAKEIKKHT